MGITIEEFAEARKMYDFLQTVLDGNSTNSHLQEGDDGIIKRWNQKKENGFQIFVPTILRPPVLRLAHYARILGHTGQIRMLKILGYSYYWP